MQVYADKIEQDLFWSMIRKFMMWNEAEQEMSVYVFTIGGFVVSEPTKPSMSDAQV